MLCGYDDHEREKPHVVGLQHLIDRDESLEHVLNIEDDWEAERASKEDPWAISKFDPDAY